MNDNKIGIYIQCFPFPIGSPEWLAAIDALLDELKKDEKK
jgi:hypothetical protein